MVVIAMEKNKVGKEVGSASGGSYLREPCRYRGRKFQAERIACAKVLGYNREEAQRDLCF